jgi:lipoprotein-anchoring transpeptidase ErfK/SrfK
MAVIALFALVGMASVTIWPTMEATATQPEIEIISEVRFDESAVPEPGGVAEPEAAIASITPEPPAPVATEPPKKPKVKKPKPATRERQARNVPEAPLDKNTGRRIVYDKALMTVWLVNKKDEVVGRFPVVGRWDRPVQGEYKIYSKSPRSGNPNSRVAFNHMTRFAYGNDGKTPIGFHDIPKYYNGKMMHSKKQLGLPVATGGCIRMAPEDAELLYRWSKVGDRVIVLPSP